MQKRISPVDLLLALAMAGLCLIGFHNHLLFHSLTELFRISVAVAIFMLVWNVRRSLDNPYLMTVSVAYVFVSGLDLLHAFAYVGVGFFNGSEANLAAQLWIAARYLEATALLTATFFIGRETRLKLVLLGFAAAAGLLSGAIFIGRLFPDALEAGGAPTLFIKISEFLVLLTFAAAIARLAKKRDHFDPIVLRLLATSIAFAFLSELCLSFYEEAGRIPYLLGHLFKIVSFYFIYKAIIETGLSKPLSVLFRNLKASEEALRRERDLMDGVLSSEDVMVAVLDREGRVVRFNRAAERLTGYSFEEMKGRQPWNLIIPDEAQKMIASLREIVSTRMPSRQELSFLNKSGKRFWLLWSISSIMDKAGMVEYLIVSGIDITERKRAEEALHRMNEELDIRVQDRTRKLAETNVLLRREIEERLRIEDSLLRSEDKYRTVADNTYDWEWWRDSEGRFTYTSPSCKRITHREAAEFIADPDLLFRIIHPEDRTFFLDHQSEVEQAEKSGETEFRILRPDGSVRWLAHACQPVFDEHGRVRGRRGSNRDITERKMAEQALRESERQLRLLSSQILTAQETERRRIARELHDELGGALAVLKLRTSFLEKNLPQDREDLKDAGRQSLDDIDRIIDNLARLSRDLSPSILEDIGLTPALRWLVGNFVKNYRVEVDADLGDLEQLFPKDSQIMIFRIFQEALTNIGKHAQAEKVSIRIRLENEKMAFLIEDDGRGFDVDIAAARDPSERGMGLATMRERARMLGGSIDLVSGQGQGTRVVFRIPVERSKGV